MYFFVICCHHEVDICDFFSFTISTTIREVIQKLKKVHLSADCNSFVIPSLSIPTRSKLLLGTC